MTYIYVLQHIEDIINDEEFYVKILGFFSSLSKAEQAIEKYKQLPGFKDKQKVFTDYEYDVGFFIDRAVINQVDRDALYITSESESKPRDIPNRSFITDKIVINPVDGDVEYVTSESESVNNTIDIPEAIGIPYWAKRDLPKLNEKAEAFVSRLLIERYGILPGQKGPGSEHDQLRLYAEHMGH